METTSSSVPVFTLASCRTRRNFNFRTTFCLAPHPEKYPTRESGLGEAAAVPAAEAEDAYAGMMERMDLLEQKVMSTEMVLQDGQEAGAFLPPLPMR